MPRAPKATEPPELIPPVPTVTIYQNSDHISGILQQLYRQPLAKQDTTEDQSSHEKGANVRGEGAVEGRGKVGWFGSSAEVGAKLAATAEAATKDSRGGKRTSVWEYTHAYYLHAVKETLRSHGLLKSVSKLSEAQTLRPGDLVEFTTDFEPDQMSAFLDVLTPELVSAIVRYQIRRNATESFDQWGNFEAQQTFFAKTAQRIEAKTELAEAVAKAVRTDFRSDETKEFFGRLGDGDESVTAVTMCDRAHFTVDDTDRILDGRFTVLAKVVAEVESNRPILERNKILSAIEPESIDDLVGKMKAQLEAGVKAANLTEQPAFDPKLSARVEGPSFKVIPIAIYV